MASMRIGIDIGGTNLRFGLVDGAGNILRRIRNSSAIEQGCGSLCSRLLKGIAELRSTAYAEHDQEVSGIGVGVPGLIGSNGLIHSSVNMTPLNGFNLSRFLTEQTGLSVSCRNDANLIALGEHVYGAGRPFVSSMTITLGTGLGSGLILDGKLWTGSGGFAAEFGHVTVEPDGLPCRCGNRGCLEQYVSASALLRHARELPEQDLPVPGEQLHASLLASLARQGHPAAQLLFEKMGHWLGIALASLLNTLNLQAIIIGGGVAASFDLLLPPLQEEIRRRCFPQIAAGVVIIKAELGDDAGLVGAAALATESEQTGA